MQSVLNTVKGTALNVAEYLTPVLKVSIGLRKMFSSSIEVGGWLVKLSAWLTVFVLG